MKKILVLLLLILLLFTVWLLLFKERTVDNQDLLNNRVINSELPISDKNDITFERDNTDFLEKESEDNNNIIMSQEQGDDPEQSITLSGFDNIIYKESVFDADITDLRKEYTSYTDTDLNNTYKTYNLTELEENNIVVGEEDVNLTIFDGNIPSLQDNESYLRGIYDLVMSTEEISIGINNISNSDDDSLFVSSIAMDEIIRVIKESELYNSPIVKAHVYLHEETNEFLGGGSSDTDSGSSGGILGGVGAGALGGVTKSATGAATSLVNMPFGGRIVKTIICTCSANTLVYVQDTKTNSVLPLVYQPGVTMLYSNYNVFTPGVNLLGTYTPGSGVCLMVSSPCNIIPSVGMMNFTPGVGTSLSPGA